MGKYMRRKAKTTNEVTLMEVPSFSGVLTRAKTLALQKAADGAGSFIQLRSRRLIKPSSPKKPKKLLADKNLEIDKNDDEGSFGENNIEIEATKRTTRETTPCNLIRDPDVIRTPASSTKPTRSTNGKYRVENTSATRIPSTSEMEEFFTGPEKQQQQLFIEKYNFDPVNDKPLNGRYEWVKLDSPEKS
uniref:cyclin-dependent kinase inhibitor 4-like n=1 Tax=Erigeron canadensis TaxID=72917 RepID=UPI001CB91CB5|nr:cyclin-dependent kinase inhibitor 4-like [Erigeron canadensis]